MISVIGALLSKQDPTQPHTLLTRLVVSFCICFGNIVLFGFYGVIAAVVVYLLGVELMGLALPWMFYSFYVGLLLGCWKAFLEVREYWVNYGH